MKKLIKIHEKMMFLRCFETYKNVHNFIDICRLVQI